MLATQLSATHEDDHADNLIISCSYLLGYWSGFEAAKTAPWPSRGLHHFGQFLEPCCFMMRWYSWAVLAHQEWAPEICLAQIWIFQFWHFRSSRRYSSWQLNYQLFTNTIMLTVELSSGGTPEHIDRPFGPLYFVPTLRLFILMCLSLPSCAFVLFHSCSSHARVFGIALVHEFHISYSPTEWYLQFSWGEIVRLFWSRLLLSKTRLWQSLLQYYGGLIYSGKFIVVLLLVLPNVYFSYHYRSVFLFNVYLW